MGKVFDLERRLPVEVPRHSDNGLRHTPTNVDPAGGHREAEELTEGNLRRRFDSTFRAQEDVA